MDSSSSSYPLDGSEIHGFYSSQDLSNLLEEASSRWLRPNEVLAILSNHKYFKIQPQPVDKPQSGRVLIFDRKMLRNFRQDGHMWKRKKDGKSIQEAHEKLKIGNEERIHVYYARGEHEPNFYRRSYWLLDKNKDRIVLVHYRRISEDKKGHAFVSPLTNKQQYDSPTTPINSTSGSAHSDLSGSAVHSEEFNSGEEQTVYIGSDSLVSGGTGLQNDEYDLDDIETFEWGDELGDLVDAYSSTGSGCVLSSQQMQYDLRNTSLNNADFLPPNGSTTYWKPIEGVDMTGCSDAKLNGGYSHAVEDQHNALLGFCDREQMSAGISQVVEGGQNPVPLFSTINQKTQAVECISNQSRNETPQISTEGVFSSQYSFRRSNRANDDSLDSLGGLQFGISSQNGHFPQNEIFTIVEMSPTWAYCTEETKVLVIGSFNESNKYLMGSNVYCIVGEKCVAVEMVQDGVYRFTALQNNPGLVNLFLTLDGTTPISQVLSFDYRSTPGLQPHAVTKPLEDDAVELSKMRNQVQTRFAHLLFSTTNTLSILSNTRQLSTLKKAQKFAELTSPLMDKEWRNLLELSGSEDITHLPGSEDLIELLLKHKLQEWLLNRVVDGITITARDRQGQGAIHLCAILDYAWAVHLFLKSGLSLDFRDTYGWTALHWAAYYGREKMVVALLTSGANASLVTYSTPENPGGCTAADLASINGYEGLAAFLAEEGLAAHMNAMSLAGNIKSPVLPTSNDTVNYENLSEQELCLKDSLAAYRYAADAAARIQDAFRERALKQQTRAVQMVKPEVEAAQIVSALKIQSAYRKYNARKMMKAAARIQSHFRTWQTRKIFLNMRNQAIRIQAVFRGHRARRQYHKVIWSVGVLEKAILRWRLKRKGLRGVKTEATEAMMVDEEQEDNFVEQDFFRIGREQAEDRMQRSVVKVQTIFRSYRAQQEYRRMKLAHQQTKLEFDSGGAVGFS